MGAYQGFTQLIPSSFGSDKPLLLANINMETESKYRFNEAKHLHQMLVGDEWKNLTGCTTILGVIAKPALIQWAADMATGQFGWIKAKEWDEEKEEYVEVPLERRLEKSKEAFEMLMKLDPKGFLTFLDNARVAHCKRKEKAGDFGTKTHTAVEALIQEAIKDGNGYLAHREVDEKPIQNFIDWAVKNKVRFLETEKNIYSEELFIGGIVDIVCEIDGQVWIGDIKTAGSGIYPEHFWQCAGYNIMLNAMGLYPNITGYLILNLKENGKMDEKRSISNEENKDAFLAALKLYRIQEKLKNNIIK